MSLKYTQDYEFPWFITRYGLETATFERYDYQQGAWVEDLELMKITVGKYWQFDEISEEKARALIDRFAEERPWEHRA